VYNDPTLADVGAVPGKVTKHGVLVPLTLTFQSAVVRLRLLSSGCDPAVTNCNQVSKIAAWLTEAIKNNTAVRTNTFFIAFSPLELSIPGSI
jgi:hypothetical protein